MQVEVSLFGAFRRVLPGDRVTLELPEGATVADARRSLSQALECETVAVRRELLARSALADDTAVLAEDAPVAAERPLAVLPPVCGG